MDPAPPTRPTPTAVIILQRIEPGQPAPPYCVHGRTVCMGECGEWLWLGSESYDVVRSREAVPMCQFCAVHLLPKGSRPHRRVDDHPRADDPDPG